MKTQLSLFGLLTAALVSASGTADAAPIIFRDGTDFRATLLPTTFESFEDEALGTGASVSFW